MNLEEYIKLATTTESRLKEVKVNPDLIVNLLYIFNASGNMLDQVKKHVFYGKEYDSDDFSVSFSSIVSALQALTLVRINGNEEEMGEEVQSQIDPRLFHAILGVATESTEMCEALYDVLVGKEIDLVNLREENGDLNWYQAIFYDTMKELGYKGTWDDDLEKNIAKLKARYPDKFCSDKAVNRDLDKERDILEKD